MKQQQILKKNPYDEHSTADVWHQWLDFVGSNPKQKSTYWKRPPIITDSSGSFSHDDKQNRQTKPRVKAILNGPLRL